MDGPPASDVGTVDAAALGRLMPMHLRVAATGRIAGVGPTLLRIARAPVIGRPVLDVVAIRRPVGIDDFGKLRRHSGPRLHLTLQDAPETHLRGQAAPMADGGVLLNLSFGIDLASAVRQHRLTDADFAPTDLAIELLYLLEAKALVMGELADLNRRLQGAKSLAEEQAHTDTLTGLRNRRALDNALQELVQQGRPFGLMHLDLDFFKQVNDTLGHAAGDHVLRHVARVLRAETRQGDTVSRVGGDEFVILLPGLTDTPGLERIAGRMIARLTTPVMFEGQPCRISASIGMVVSTTYGLPRPEVLLSDADAALYSAKRGGRGRWIVREARSAPDTAEKD